MAAPIPLPIPPTLKVNHPSSTPDSAYDVPSSARPRGDMATMCDHSPRRPLRTCVQRQEPLILVRVPACAWGVFLAIDLSWCELVALPLRDTRSKISQTI